VEDQVSEVASALSALYGAPQLLTEGVLHVTSAVRTSVQADARAALRVIAVGPRAPQSTTDFFVLNACRARADALLTTAAILRSEPGLVHTLQGPYAAPLARYRAAELHKAEPPLCAILTRSAVLPVAHPVWSDGTRKLVLTTPESAAALRALLGSRAEVVALSGLDARSAIALLQERGHALVSVEAGPSTTAPLYRAPGLVDELLLSLYEGPLEGVELGGELPDQLLEGRECLGESEREEESGRWRFQRWGRAQ